MAGNYVILAKAGITTTGTTAVVGDIGISPGALSDTTGFGSVLHGSYATSSIVTGRIYASDMADPTPANLSSAVNAMQIAYLDAAGRTPPDFTELGAGDISGKTLVPGLYKWSTGVLINTDVTLSGGPDDVWIFQIGSDLTMASAKNVILSGGARAKNIFWQLYGVASIGTGAHFEGVIMAQTAVALDTGATINGRLLAETVTLDANAVTQP